MPIRRRPARACRTERPLPPLGRLSLPRPFSAGVAGFCVRASRCAGRSAPCRPGSALLRDVGQLPTDPNADGQRTSTGPLASAVSVIETLQASRRRRTVPTTAGARAPTPALVGLRQRRDAALVQDVEPRQVGRLLRDVRVADAALGGLVVDRSATAPGRWRTAAGSRACRPSPCTVPSVPTAVVDGRHRRLAVACAVIDRDRSTPSRSWRSARRWCRRPCRWCRRC